MLSTSAVAGTGVEQLFGALDAHAAFRKATGAAGPGRSKAFRILKDILVERAEVNVERLLTENDAAKRLVADVASGAVDPYAAADSLAALLGAGALKPS